MFRIKKVVRAIFVGWSSRLGQRLICLGILISLVSCTPPARVSAEERMFRDFSLEYIAQYEIPKTTYRDTPIGGLSAIAYDREQDIFYVLSDDRSKRAPARFYSFKLKLQSTEQGGLKIEDFAPQNLTILRDEQAEEFAKGQIDPEGLALSSRNTVFISSEGNTAKNIKPFIAEFDLATGVKLGELPLPEHYLATEETQGVQENLGFESLTINRTNLAQDPFRVFTATESALVQDETFAGEEQPRVRLLHYVVNPIGRPIIIAEHLYLLESAQIEVISNGLTELLALPKEGHFLSLERTFGFTGAGAKIFQAVIGNATDTTEIESLKGDLSQVRPIQKKLLFDLAELGVYLDNFEGMTLGPRLPDGSRSLLLISDDNFNEEQITQLFLFRLTEN